MMDMQLKQEINLFYKLLRFKDCLLSQQNLVTLIHIYLLISSLLFSLVLSLWMSFCLDVRPYHGNCSTSFNIHSLLPSVTPITKLLHIVQHITSTIFQGFYFFSSSLFCILDSLLLWLYVH